jgi:hypothetical protein
VVVVVIPADVLLAIIGFIDFEMVEEGGFSLLGGETILDGCFKRETFEFVVVVVVVVVVRFGNCEIDLLLFLMRLPFGIGGVFGMVEEVGRVGLVLLLRRTVEADDAVSVDDELLFKR